MSKTLVIAEKPSVGRDLARVLPGPFTKGEGYLEGPEHLVTWAVGHLVQLADPDEYDERFKNWRMADLPIVPDRFKLVIRDERSKKQMNAVKRLLHRDDVDRVVNARLSLLPPGTAPAVLRPQPRTRPRLARPSSGSPQSLSQGRDQTTRSNLGHALDCSNVYTELKCRRCDCCRW